MALYVHYTDIEGWEGKCVMDAGTDAEGKQLWQRTPEFDGLGYLFMLVGMDEITDGNWREFWLRCKMAERCYGAFFRKADGSDHLIEPDYVKKFIGARANPSPMTKVQFRTRLDHNMRAEFGRALAKWEGEQRNAVDRLEESIHRPVPEAGG